MRQYKRRVRTRQPNANTRSKIEMMQTGKGGKYNNIQRWEKDVDKFISRMRARFVRGG